MLDLLLATILAVWHTVMHCIHPAQEDEPIVDQPVVLTRHERVTPETLNKWHEHGAQNNAQAAAAVLV